MYDTGVYIVGDKYGSKYGIFNGKYIYASAGQYIDLILSDDGSYSAGVYRYDRLVFAGDLAGSFVNKMELIKSEKDILDIVDAVKLSSTVKAEINCSYWVNRWWK